jgi:hypothetical protein
MCEVRPICAVWLIGMFARIPKSIRVVDGFMNQTGVGETGV